MKSLVRTTLIAMLLVGGSAFGAQVSLGIRIGAPPKARVEVRTAQPGPDYNWVDGYWYPDAGHYKWHAGYWTRPPYAGAHWVAPHHDGQQFFNGYWDGEHGRVEHDHKTDRGKVRDYHP